MTISAEEFEQLRLLFSGSLPPKEAKALQKRLEEDGAFRVEAIEYLSLFQQLRAIDPARHQIKTILENTALTPKPEKGLILSLSLMRYSAVATVVLLLGFSSYFLYNLSLNPSVNLSENELPNIISDFTKSVKGEIPSAEFEFRQKHYEQAAEEYFLTLQTAPQDMDLLYNYAVACFMDEQWGKAQQTFERLAANTQFHKHEDAAFYQAICLLNEKKDEQGLKLLERIAKQKEHKKSISARAIWKRVKKK